MRSPIAQAGGALCAVLGGLVQVGSDFSSCSIWSPILFEFQFFRSPTIPHRPTGSSVCPQECSFSHDCQEDIRRIQTYQPSPCESSRQLLATRFPDYLALFDMRSPLQSFRKAGWRSRSLPLRQVLQQARNTLQQYCGAFCQ